jgi:hypothetical protein
MVPDEVIGSLGDVPYYTLTILNGVKEQLT